MQLEEELSSRLPQGQSLVTRSFNFNIGNLSIQPQYWQAILILALIFVLLLSIARYRHLYVKWNLKGFLPSVLFGIILAFVIEGFLLIGGRTVFTELLGWESAPKPISTALDSGRERLVDVLGVSQEISSASAEARPTYESVILDLEELSEQEMSQVRGFICQPE